MREKVFPLPMDAVKGILPTLTPDAALALLRSLTDLADGRDPECPLTRESDFAPFRVAAARMRRVSGTRSAAAKEIWARRKGREEASPNPPGPARDDGASVFKALEEPDYRRANRDAAQYILKSGIGMTVKSWQEFREFTEDSGIPDDLVIWAVDRAIDKDSVTTKWRYAKKILDACITENVRTVEEARARAEQKAKEEREKNNGRGSKTGNRPTDGGEFRAAQKRLEEIGLADDFV